MDVRVTAKVDTRNWQRGVQDLLYRLDRATRQGCDDAAATVERRTKLRLREKSHPPGTKTPSEPGEPPALITGALARSVRSEPARPLAGWAWRSRVGPTNAYGRIQELGGVSGYHHHTHLPPRPYLLPATNETRRLIRGKFARRWREVIVRA